MYKIDILVLIILLIFSNIVSYLTVGTPLGNVTMFSIFFAVPPTIYLMLRSKKDYKKIFISSFLFGFLFLFPFDLIAQYTRTWDTLSYLFIYHIAGIKLTFDNLIWGTLMTMYGITFYQHFILKNIENYKISKKLMPTLIITLIMIIFILLLIFIHPVFFLWRYPYLVMGTLAILPLLTLLLHKPYYLKRMLICEIFFFFFYFSQEIFGVSNHYWVYPGNNYIAWINIMGKVFPFEELFFWVMLYVPTLITYYEIFLNKEN